MHENIDFSMHLCVLLLLLLLIFSIAVIVALFRISWQGYGNNDPVCSILSFMCVIM
jgi:Co/Zn/Cd efflux system component